VIASLVMDANDPLGASVLHRAASHLGGTRQLRMYLRVSALSLGVWMAGGEPPPRDVFLKAVDVIVDAEIQKIRSG
jgi:hypothetical protein